jgi:hypothetical protein
MDIVPPKTKLLQFLDSSFCFLTVEPVAKTGYFCTDSCSFSPNGCKTGFF